MADVAAPFLFENLDLLRRSYALLREPRQLDEPARSSVVAELRASGAQWRSLGHEVGAGTGEAMESLAAALGADVPDALLDRWRAQIAGCSIALVASAHRAGLSGSPSAVPLVGPDDLPPNAWWRREVPSDRNGSIDPGLAVYAVVHVADERQALEQAGVAFEAGTDGVFLINHAVGIDELLDAYGAVRQTFGPTAWIGINALGGEPVAVVRDALSRGFPSMFDGLWTDNACIDERSIDQPATYRELRSLWDGVYFGGVAFKYQRAVEDLASAARASAGHVDVLTTSGSGTGSAPTAEKIEALVNAAPGLPVAIASGITPENVATIAGRAHAVLVATGISRDFEHLDPTRVRALVETAGRVGETPTRELTRQVVDKERAGGRSGHPGR